MSASLFIEFGGIIITVFSVTVIFILEKTADRRSNYLYLFFASVFSIQLVSFFEKFNVIISGPIGTLVSTIEFIILCSGIFLVLPSLYLFIYSKIEAPTSKIKKQYLAIPLCLTAIMTVLVIIGSTYNLFDKNVIIVLICLLFLFYSFYFGRRLFQVIKKYKRIIEDTYSNTEELEMKWVVKLSYSFLVLVGIIIGNEILIAYLSLSALKYTYNASKKENIVPLQEESVSPKKLPNQKEGLFEQINTIVNNQLLCLNPSLNISDVAKEVGVNYKYVSQEINANGLTFLEFINSKRIEKAKEFLADKSNQFLPIDEIAYKAGFKSKATFYKYFKDIVGTTPSNYRNSIRY